MDDRPAGRPQHDHPAIGCSTRIMAVKINKLAGIINTHCWQICYLAGLLERSAFRLRHILRF
jgi:hypothetical protein